MTKVSEFSFGAGAAAAMRIDSRVEASSVSPRAAACVPTRLPMICYLGIGDCKSGLSELCLIFFYFLTVAETFEASR